MRRVKHRSRLNAGMTSSVRWASNARVTEVHDLRADERTHKARNCTPKTRWFAFRTSSAAIHLFANPFRPLSEICAGLSPHSQPVVNSTHRRTNSEIMTSDWCSEAGWFGCRFDPGQAGKVRRAQVPRRLNLLPWVSVCWLILRCPTGETRRAWSGLDRGTAAVGQSVNAPDFPGERPKSRSRRRSRAPAGPGAIQVRYRTNDGPCSAVVRCSRTRAPVAARCVGVPGPRGSTGSP